MTKLCILGIDGASPALIEQWCAQGHLPHFKTIMDRGVFGPLESTVPPITPCAWSTFMTGVNPGKHGVYDFFYLDDDHRMRIHSAATRRARDLWEYLGDRNVRSFVFNVPFTYPPRKINGTMVAGFMTPSTHTDFTYPPEVKQDILRHFKNYKPSQDSKYAQNPATQYAFRDESFALSDLRFDVARHLLKDQSYDFMMMVFNLTDHMQHWYWKDMDPSHPKHEPNSEFADTILDAYGKMDAVLGELMERYADYNIMILSDHGCGPRYKDVVINHWLKEQGYLFLKKRVSPVKNLMSRIGAEKIIALGLNLGLWGLLKKMPLCRRLIQRGLMLTYDDIDWKKTQVYSHGYYGPLYINRAVVASDDQYQALRQELMENIGSITDPLSGGPLVTKMWTREQLYHGPYAPHLPDVILKMGDYSFTCSSTFPFSANTLFSEPKTFGSGDHRQCGVFMAYGDAFKENYRLSGARLMDLAPTVLAMYDVPVPQAMDGVMLEEIFKDGAVTGAGRDDRSDAGPQDIMPETSSYTDDEEAAMKDRLRSLGYL